MAETLSGGYPPLPAAAPRRRAGSDRGLDEATQRAGRVPAFPDCAAALDRLRAAGIETGVLTNNARQAAEEALVGRNTLVLAAAVTAPRQRLRARSPLRNRLSW
ncbi:MAG: hypothetical protein ACRDM7_23430 [Thermoleophilaceae bacterium]